MALSGLPSASNKKLALESLSDQGEQPEHMITGTASVGKVLLDIEDRVLIEEPVQHIGRLAFGGTDGQNAEVAVLI